MVKPKDITGERFGKLTALCSTGKKDKTGAYVWKFQCDCGTFTNRSTNTLNNMRKAGRCKNCNSKERSSRMKQQATKHGAYKDQLYTAWRNIKSRCYNSKNISFDYYGAIGITIQENWINDFVKFKEYIGDPPNDGQRWTIERIDNSLGYQEGNIRWATYFEQAKNKPKRITNTSGATGVSFDKNSCMYLAKWFNLESKVCQKSFSVKKLGEEEAFKQACEYREMMIKELNLQGAGYSESHGKDRGLKNK